MRQSTVDATITAHAVLHSDLKPENVMLGQFGEVYLVAVGGTRAPGCYMRSTGAADGETRAQCSVSAGAAG